jgi:predicted alpha/beta hydrolase family esterase
MVLAFDGDSTINNFMALSIAYIVEEWQIKLMKTQVIVIHGGSTYKSYADYIGDLKKTRYTVKDIREEMTWVGWKESLNKNLGNKFDVLALEMPNRWNAHYHEWEIWFEKIIAEVEPNSIFIGHSLGAIFLAKYFCLHNYNKMKNLLLVAAPYNDSNTVESLEKFVMPKNVSRLQKLGNKVHLYFSKDDKVVPFSEFKKFKRVLPDAVQHIFEGKGHFNTEHFSEILADIKNLSKS